MLLWIDRLRRDQRASGMVFGALSMFCLVCFLAYTCNVTQITTIKIKMQSAADAAAYSGAVVQANIIALVAFINNMMVWVYRFILALIVVEIVLTICYALSWVPGMQWAVGAYHTFVNYGQGLIPKWIDGLLKVIQFLWKIEKAIAKAAAFLIELEVFRIARLNGADLAAAYPIPVGFGGSKAFLQMDPQHPERFMDNVAGPLGGLGGDIAEGLSWIGGVDIGKSGAASASHTADCPHCDGGKCASCGGDGKLDCGTCASCPGHTGCSVDQDGNHVHGPTCWNCSGRAWNGCPHCNTEGQGGTAGDGLCATCDGKGEESSSAESNETYDGDLPPPLTLTQEFFKSGINVGAWKRSEDAIFLPRTPSMPAGIFDNPDWGVFTFASARAFSPNFSEGDIEATKNLYEQDWRAKLISLKEGGFFEAFGSGNWKWFEADDPSQPGSPDDEPNLVEKLMQH